MFLGLRTVIQRVRDIAAARAWYTQAFGVEPYYDSPYYVGFQVGGYELGLDPDLSEGSPGPGGTVAYWGVADAQAAWDRILELGAKPVTAVRDVGGGIKIGVVADPDGNAIGLIENPNFGTESANS